MSMSRPFSEFTASEKVKKNSMDIITKESFKMLSIICLGYSQSHATQSTIFHLDISLQLPRSDLTTQDVLG